MDYPSSELTFQGRWRPTENWEWQILAVLLSPLQSATFKAVCASWPHVNVSSRRKIKSSHQSYFPLSTRILKGALTFPSAVHFRVHISSWGAALDENSSFQAWFHSGSAWELGKTSKLKAPLQDSATVSLVCSAGGQASGTGCSLLASLLIVPVTADTTYTIIPIFAKCVDTMPRRTLHALCLSPPPGTQPLPGELAWRIDWLQVILASLLFILQERGSLVGLVILCGNK